MTVLIFCMQPYSTMIHHLWKFHLLSISRTYSKNMYSMYGVAQNRPCEVGLRYIICSKWAQLAQNVISLYSRRGGSEACGCQYRKWGINIHFMYLRILWITLTPVVYYEVDSTIFLESVVDINNVGPIDINTECK